MGNRLRAGAYHLDRYATSHPGQLSLLPFVGRGVSIYWPKCGDALRPGVRAGWLILFVDKRVGGG